MKRVLLTIHYLGTRYAGWQRQANATGIQQVMEEVLERLFHAPVILHSAGRTDAGVHAAGQRAHADIPVDIPPRGLTLGINDHLPPDIRVTRVIEVPGTFHARFDAMRKRYVYRIWNASVDDVFRTATHAHVVQDLDERLMRNAAKLLEGEHDFGAFTVISPEVSSTVRTIRSVEVVREGRSIAISVTADGFLRYMMRRIAGSLIEIGRGKIGVETVDLALHHPEGEARWTAPAKGLTLDKVEYGIPELDAE